MALVIGKGTPRRWVECGQCCSAEAGSAMTEPLFSQIVINDAYAEPRRHLNLLRVGPDEILPGRRPAGYYLGSRSSADEQVTQREWRELTGVSKVRERVGRWREAGFPGTTPVTRALLEWWQRSDRPGVNLFFCQREAAETIIW